MILFWVFILVLLLLIIQAVFSPLLKLCRIGKTLSYEKAGKIIGEHFEEINDKIINIIQLRKMTTEDNDLIQANNKITSY